MRLLAFFISVALSSLALAGPRPDLRGQVTDATGKPVEKATVFIYTAGVKHGYSTYCPGCYPDCGKHTQADSAGGFNIGSLDPELIFRVLAVADGFKPQFVTKVDPGAGPLTIKLEARPAQPKDSKCVVNGVVLDTEGKPLANAVVTPDMVWFTETTGQGGQVDGLDPLAVTNEQGEFAVTYKEPALKMTVTAEHRGLATSRARDLSTGNEVHIIRMINGAMLRGRLMNNGKPVANALMGLVQTSRNSETWIGEQTIGTDKDGRFDFVNITPGFDWYLYAKMDSIKDFAASPAKKVSIQKDEEVVEFGDLALGPGHHFSGRVILTDGAAIPDGMRASLSRQSAWDSQTITLAPDGTFDFVNVPTDDLSLNVSIRDYHPSKLNPSLGFMIEGRLAADVKDFIILMDSGKDDYSGRYGGTRVGQPFISAVWPQAK